MLSCRLPVWFDVCVLGPYVRLACVQPGAFQLRLAHMTTCHVEATGLINQQSVTWFCQPWASHLSFSLTLPLPVTSLYCFPPLCYHSTAACLRCTATASAAAGGRRRRNRRRGAAVYCLSSSSSTTSQRCDKDDRLLHITLSYVSFQPSSLLLYFFPYNGSTSRGCHPSLVAHSHRGGHTGQCQTSSHMGHDSCIVIAGYVLLAGPHCMLMC